MALTVQPITALERVHCAYCAKPLQPAYKCHKTFYRHSMEAKGRTCEEQLAAYQTNQRVVRIARSYSKKYDAGGTAIGREVSSIEVVHMPEANEWRLWGKFCGRQCAARFGYACHEAGWRMPRKS